MRHVYIVCTIALSLIATTSLANPKGNTSNDGTKSNQENQISEDPNSELTKEGISAFGDVYKVLQHPRCLNCHPSGDAPLQSDDSKPHAMNITRVSVEAGLECAACHQEKNSEVYGVVGGPPGAPNWHLPEKEMPLIFEGRSVKELCEQLTKTEENGNKTLQELYEHVAFDPLVLWGWEPGGERSIPPIAHADFAKQFKQWVDAGGPCPSK
jgi:hypothetical protein